MGTADEIRRRAFELARSGHHIDCLTIETELADDGFPEAYVVLQDLQVRAELKAICDEHRRDEHRWPDTTKD
jgi:hypothetical protein